MQLVKVWFILLYVVVNYSGITENNLLIFRIFLANFRVFVNNHLARNQEVDDFDDVLWALLIYTFSNLKKKGE